MTRNSFPESLFRTYRALEWERLKECLAFEAETAWGKEISLSVEPADEPIVVESLLDETQEALSLISANTPLSLQNLPDLREVLARISAGASLSASELLSVRAVLVAGRTARASLSLLDTGTFPQLTKYAIKVHLLDKLVGAITAAIDDTGEIKDNASPLLQKLRREVRTIDRRIKDELNKIIHSSVLSKALQEPIFTQRSGRYVLPVNSSSRGTIAGIVHDSSASGLTVYVEPASVVEMANDLRLKESEIDREISRILAELSGQAHGQIEQIESTFGTLIELDCIFARARLAHKYRGQRPEISNKNSVQLRQARHPLLALQYPSGQVVGNDIILGGDVKTMIVTGPNTGGKTVLLKTLGLLALMMKAGMLLPVDPGSTCIIFSEVYADIGDEQSIEQSLSTFSSHMTNIIEIVNKACANSLVILDEIGAGTDPREGAALARAILEHLNQSGAYTVSATHFGELKTLAYVQKGFVNASLEFNEATLSPSYKLRIGIPGGSKATTIARRLGLNDRVVEQAESYMQAEDHDIQEIIEKLETKLENLAAIETEVQETKARTDLKEKEVEKRLSELTDRDEKSRVNLIAGMEAEFKQANQTVRELIASLQKEPSLQKAEKFKKEMEQVKKDLHWLEESNQPGSASQLAVGATVKILSLNRNGTVEALPPNYESDPKAVATVHAGGLRLKLAVGDLKYIAAAATARELSASRDKSQAKARGKQQARVDEPGNVFVRTLSNTLDLRGQRVDESLSSLERFLDTCSLQNISPTMIIHGHGTGAVKSAVRSYLSTSAYIKKFRPGEIYEGGDGVTVVDIA